MKAGKPYGVPQLTKEQLTNLALHEGRDDFGLNLMNSNNKKAMAISKALQKEGLDPYGADFAGAIYDKHQVANKVGIPFEHAWNGKGVVEGTRRTGADYAKEAKEMNYAAYHPKNAEMLDYIDRALNGKETEHEKLIHKIRSTEDNDPYQIGEVYKRSLLKNVTDPNAQKLLNQADPDVLQSLIYNKVRDAYNVNTRPVMMENPKSGAIMPGMTDAAQITSIAVEHPEIKALIDKRVQDTIKQIGPTIPTNNAVTMPEQFRAGGRTRLI